MKGKQSGTGIGAVVLALAGACGISCNELGSVLPVPDGGSDAAFTVSTATVGRGEYLARSVAACGECHTPRDAQGNLDMSRWLAGVADRFDLAPLDDSIGAIGAPNLTPHASGLAKWTDDQVRRAIVDGVSFDGTPLAPVMPSYVFHNMTDDDAKAIVVYLRTLPPIDNAVPPRQPLPVPLTAPVAPVPESAILHTTLPQSDPSFARAEHGRYLAAEVGMCMDCHSPWHFDSSPPLDLHALFAGGRPLSAKEWVVASPPAPAVVYSYNVTPHTTGIEGWDAPTVARAIASGLDNAGQSLCRPMPSGPMGSFGGMLADDAFDIGLYLTTLPPIDSGDIPACPRQ